MTPVNVKISILGQIPSPFFIKKIKNRKSCLFNVVDDIGRFHMGSNADLPDWGYSDENILKQLPKRDKAKEDILLVITHIALEDNYFARVFSDNRICLTYHEAVDILDSSNIPVENLIFRTIYAICISYLFFNKKVPMDIFGHRLFHDETRGCLFDMNGIKNDIIYSSNKPNICSKCVDILTTLDQHKIDKNVIDKVQAELKKIKREPYYEITDFIKKHPYLSFFLSTLIALLLGITGSIIASLIYHPK